MRGDLGHVGEHFKLHDCRRWVRLHFWACRRAGLFPATEGGDDEQAVARAPSESGLDPKMQAVFMDWYVRFIGHFVKVYERSAPPFVRADCRWSAKQENIDAYLAAGSVMSDITDKFEKMSSREYRDELEKYLTPGEIGEVGRWPYSL